MSQKAILLKVLEDYKPHRSDELVRIIYSVRNGVFLARLSARVYDLKQEGHEIKSWLDKNRRLCWYQMTRPHLQKSKVAELSETQIPPKQQGEWELFKSTRIELFGE